MQNKNLHNPDLIVKKRKRFIQSAEIVYASVRISTMMFVCGKEMIGVLDMWKKNRPPKFWTDHRNRSCYWWWESINNDLNNEDLARILEKVPHNMRIWHPDSSIEIYRLLLDSKKKISLRS